MYAARTVGRGAPDKLRVRSSHPPPWERPRLGERVQMGDALYRVVSRKRIEGTDTLWSLDLEIVK